MFTHEEHLAKALKECQISKLVYDLGALYTTLANQSGASNDEFQVALQVERILQETAAKIAVLGAKPQIRR